MSRLSDNQPKPVRFYLVWAENDSRVGIWDILANKVAPFGIPTEWTTHGLRASVQELNDGKRKPTLYAWWTEERWRKFTDIKPDE